VEDMALAAEGVDAGHAEEEWGVSNNAREGLEAATRLESSGVTCCAALAGRLSEGGARARARQIAPGARLLLDGAGGEERLAAQETHPGAAAHGPALVGGEAGDAQVLAGRIVHSEAGSQRVRSASAPMRIVPFRE